jgi:hypothetical protein
MAMSGLMATFILGLWGSFMMIIDLHDISDVRKNLIGALSLLVIIVFALGITYLIVNV